MNFKEQLSKDIDNVFFNANEFGEEVTINDEKMLVVMDDEELQLNNLSKVDNQARGNSLSRGVILFHVNRSYFNHIPQADKLMKFNNETYRIEDVKENEKVLTIMLGKYSG